MNTAEFSYLPATFERHAGIDPRFDRDEDMTRALTPQQLDLMAAGLEIFEAERALEACQ